jgi:hypothetical protein
MLPTLTIAGSIDDKLSIMTKLYEYFLASRKSQSHFFKNVASLDYLMSIHEPTDEDLGMAIKRELVELYSNYFTDVTVTVNLTTEDNSFYSVGILIETGDGYTLDRSVSVVSNKIEMFNKNIRLYK